MADFLLVNEQDGKVLLSFKLEQRKLNINQGGEYGTKSECETYGHDEPGDSS
jgi:hypothetical protein